VDKIRAEMLEYFAGRSQKMFEYIKLLTDEEIIAIEEKRNKELDEVLKFVTRHVSAARDAIDKEMLRTLKEHP
jgi:hypothetical protein